jgi:hypothetical protein
MNVSTATPEQIAAYEDILRGRYWASKDYIFIYLSALIESLPQPPDLMDVFAGSAVDTRSDEDIELRRRTFLLMLRRVNQLSGREKVLQRLVEESPGYDGAVC